MKVVKYDFNCVDEVIKKLGMDWREFVFEGEINLINADISEIKLPYDSDFFQKIKGRSLLSVNLPKVDLSKYNMKGIDMRDADLSKVSYISDNPNFFKELKNADLSNTVFPIGDYSGFDFEGVKLKGSSLSYSIVKYINKHNMEQFYNEDFSVYCGVATREQIDIIKLKYPDLQERKIVLPVGLKKDDNILKEEIKLI